MGSWPRPACRAAGAGHPAVARGYPRFETEVRLPNSPACRGDPTNAGSCESDRLKRACSVVGPTLQGLAGARSNRHGLSGVESPAGLTKRAFAPLEPPSRHGIWPRTASCAVRTFDRGLGPFRPQKGPPCGPWRFGKDDRPESGRGIGGKTSWLRTRFFFLQRPAGGSRPTRGGRAKPSGGPGGRRPHAGCGVSPPASHGGRGGSSPPPIVPVGPIHRD